MHGISLLSPDSVIVDLTTKDEKFEESLRCCELCIYVCNVFLYHRRHFNENMMNDLKKLKCPIEKTTTAVAAAVVVASASPSHRHRNRNEHGSREIENEKKANVIKLQSSLKNAFDFR